MDAQFIAQMLDRGIVIGLFVITFVLVLYKGIPAAFSIVRESLDKINAEHTHQINTLTKSYESTIDKLSDKFLNQIEKQHVEQQKYHEEHGKLLKEVADMITDTTKKPRTYGNKVR